MKRTFIPLLFLAAVAAASLPAIEDTIVIRDWLVAGPFPAAPREGIAGAIPDAAAFRPVEGETLRSALMPGGVTTVQRIAADSLGWLQPDWSAVQWDTLQDYYGIAGLYCAGLAYAEFSVPRAGRALAVCPRVGGFTLNGLGYTGDVYGGGWFVVPVPLDSGLNRLVLRLGGFGADRVRFALVPPGAAVQVIGRDATLPDIVDGTALSAWAGIPLLNTTDRRFDSVRLRIEIDTVAVETLIRNLPAFSSKKVPLRLAFPAVACDSARPRYPLVVTVTAGGETSAETLWADVRRPAQPRRETFISRIDGSCQYYAAMYPKDFDPRRRYPVIFTLHGAGVEAWGQANAYQPKDWAFVVAPTNRRPYGFDWQDWGRLDAMEVLDTILARLPLDPDRVLLTGGSMGGHGNWHVGVHHADRFAVAAPQAGWPTHQLYVPWFLQRSQTFAQPGQLAIRDRVLRSDNVPALLGNALNLPYFILHGEADDNVPPLHARNLAAWLDELGQPYHYYEMPGKGHWWTDEALGITVCDETTLVNYIREQRRDPGPRHVRLRTPDLGTSHRAYWVDVERVGVTGQDATIEAWAEDSRVRVSTGNVEQFSLELIGRPFFSGRVEVEIDGRLVGRSGDVPARLTFHRTDRGWRPGPSPAGRLPKTPERYGPARQAMMKPFAIVYGTRDPALAGWLRHAAIQEANRWWLIGNGACEVLPDTELTRAHSDSLNLVLFGGPKENSITARIGSRLPVRIEQGRVRLGTRDLGAGAAALCVYPNPENPRRLVLVRMGTDADATRLITSFGVVSSSAGTPDFVVFDERVRRYAWAGVRAAGLFGPDWNLDERSLFVEQ